MMDEEIISFWCQQQLHDVHHVNESSRSTVRASLFSDVIFPERDTYDSDDNDSAETRNDLPVHNNSTSALRKMKSLHVISCPQCSKEFHPQLHITCYHAESETIVDGKVSHGGQAMPSSEIDSAQSHTRDNNETLRMLESSSENIAVMWSQRVNYLSSFGLRFALEDVRKF
jgi:hypothetical protein